jgi:hypothetical protein
MNEILFSTTNDGISKGSIDLFASQVVNNVKEGNLDPLKLSLKLKAIERAIDTIRKEISEQVLNEASKYGKSFELDGVKVEVKENGVKYDYSDCGDEDWNEYNQIKKQAETNMKLREMYLKNIRESFDKVDTDGVVTRINPPKKSSTTSLTMTFK